MTKQEMQSEALDRATNGQALTNLPAIYSGFLEKGIAETDILPRVNVLTYQAWQAKGRQVRNGEHGVQVCTFIQATKHEKDATGKEVETTFRRPRSTAVFHISQTDPISPTERGRAE